jgi:hypothetical protein
MAVLTQSGERVSDDGRPSGRVACIPQPICIVTSAWPGRIAVAAASHAIHVKMRRQQKRKIIERMGCITATGYEEQRPPGTTPIERLDFDAWLHSDETNLMR